MFFLGMAVWLVLAIVAMFVQRRLAPRFERPPLENYVRTTVIGSTGAWTCEPGLELRDGDVFRTVMRDLHDVATAAVLDAAHDDPFARAQHAALRVREVWPDRAYFVEFHQNLGPHAGWVQIFQPFGVPRNR